MDEPPSNECLVHVNESSGARSCHTGSDDHRLGSTDSTVAGCSCGVPWLMVNGRPSARALGYRGAW